MTAPVPLEKMIEFTLDDLDEIAALIDTFLADGPEAELEMLLHAATALNYRRSMLAMYRRQQVPPEGVQPAMRKAHR